MKTILFLVLFLLSLSLLGNEVFSDKMLLMGCDFEITVVAKDAEQGAFFIQLAVDEIKRIETLISSWDEHSQTSLINRSAGGKGVAVDKELIDLIERSKRLSQITDGAFDITFSSLNELWKFDGEQHNIPNEKEITKALGLVGSEKIVIDHKSGEVTLAHKAMKIGFGAIGKGYAADKAKELLMNHHVSSGIINASGDMTLWGSQISGEEWKVAITNPFNQDEVFAVLPFTEGAIVTSGNYVKFIIIEGDKYSHIIDPRTGIPAIGLSSVTVFAPKGELADALATSIFVLGAVNGLELINQIPQVECVIVDNHGVVTSSENIEIKKS